mmetsp:Transcript_19700/g.29417  ORF Transcript_19700/g.29417 Transcript_19700/m.29417 type:complete len:899 (-) Transcript_19700:57-2753(-)
MKPEVSMLAKKEKRNGSTSGSEEQLQDKSQSLSPSKDEYHSRPHAKRFSLSKTMLSRDMGVELVDRRYSITPQSLPSYNNDCNQPVRSEEKRISLCDMPTPQAKNVISALNIKTRRRRKLWIRSNCIDAKDQALHANSDLPSLSTPTTPNSDVSGLSANLNEGPAAPPVSPHSTIRSTAIHSLSGSMVKDMAAPVTPPSAIRAQAFFNSPPSDSDSDTEVKKRESSQTKFMQVPPGTPVSLAASTSSPAILSFVDQDKFETSMAASRKIHVSRMSSQDSLSSVDIAKFRVLPLAAPRGSLVMSRQDSVAPRRNSVTPVSNNYPSTNILTRTEKAHSAPPPIDRHGKEKELETPESPGILPQSFAGIQHQRALSTCIPSAFGGRPFSIVMSTKGEKKNDLKKETDTTSLKSTKNKATTRTIGLPMSSFSVQNEASEQESKMSLSYATQGGMLWKQSPRILKSWQKRYFYLFEDRLYYFRQTGYKCIGCIVLNKIIAVTKANNDETQFSLTLEGGRIFTLRTPTQSVRERWFGALKHNMKVLLTRSFDSATSSHLKSLKHPLDSKYWNINNDILPSPEDRSPTELSRRSIVAMDAIPDEKSKDIIDSLDNKEKKSLKNERNNDLSLVHNKTVRNAPKKNGSGFWKRKPKYSSNTMPNPSRKKKSLDDTTSRDSYWKNRVEIPQSNSALPSIHWKDYVKDASTGDILLFETKNFSGSVVRTATRSRYDHIAIILVLSTGSRRHVGVLEALGNHGVQLHNFSAFARGWHKQYTTMAVRRLNFNPRYGAQSRAELSKFVREAVGKPYKWSPTMHFRKASTMSNTPIKSFFCSELVAKAYKVMALLRPDLPSSVYIPGSFEMSSGMTLLSGASLESEIALEFSEKEKPKMHVSPTSYVTLASVH